MAACNHAVHIYAGAKGRPIAGKKAIPNPPQKLLYNMVLLWVNALYTQQSCTPGYTTTEMSKKKQALDLQGLALGGDSWTRTNDPIDVNDVLSRSGQNIKPFSKPPDPLISKGWRLLGVRRFSSKRYAIRLNVQCAQLIVHLWWMWTSCHRWCWRVASRDVNEKVGALCHVQP